MSYTYELMWLPSLVPDSYVLVTSRGDSVAVRHYASAKLPPHIDRSRSLASIEAEARQAGAPVIRESAKSTENASHWWMRIAVANRKRGLAPGSHPSPATATARPPRIPSSSAPMVDHRGRALVTLADWQALHPERHWKAGYSAMELARSWREAAGFPPAVANALRKGPFEDLAFVRGIAECRTPVPGAGRPSHTDLMVEARDAGGQGVAIAVEGKVNESFGPLVGAWRTKVDDTRSAENKAERLAGLCDGLQLSVDDPATDRLRYQLLHRTWAALSHAESMGASRSVLLVHSFATGPDADNRAAFREFLRAMGQSSFELGHPIRLGERRGIELWAAWVSDTPLPRT